ncbi:hypothetical protein VTK73DRAFT_1811 [Phialemonium thermophilum]|uniref:Mediator of RNA polymerase II transcription subunit 17 n=1 Tax=Phialemonium thermophilum TaxID=223376 RepID=A0ABR3X7Q7_9PEZI
MFSLQPPPPDDRKPKTLAEFIARVNAQNGGFRTVREDELHKLVEAEEQGIAESVDVDMSDGSDTEEDGETVKDIKTARDEILWNIEMAHRNALLTLDFVSLLLSKETPVQAGTTLSKELREMVGIGTLGATSLAAPNLTETKIRDNKLVATGRKLLDINKTADTVLSAATRLQNEISLETKYWAEVLAVSDSGWSVSRLPRERHTMGVKFGFSESAPEFSAQSVAPMRRAEDGTVDLDTGAAGAESKRLLVTIERSGKIVGRSPLPSPLPRDAPLEARVLEARNSIFAQELWHEMNREGRTLLSYGVRLGESNITYDIGADSKLDFRLVTVGEEGDVSGPDVPGAEDGTAQAICSVLYLLLSYGHRQNARKRTQNPLFASAQARAANPPHHLLRPVLAFLQFENSAQRLIRLLSDVVSLLQSAGMTTASYTISEQLVTLRRSLPPPEALMTVLLSPLTFKSVLTITPEARLEISANTFTAQYVANLFRITLLPPASAGDGQDSETRKTESPGGPLADITGNPLSVSFPPAESYPTLRDVFLYIREAVPRVLADWCNVLAASLSPPTVASSLPPASTLAQTAETQEAPSSPPSGQLPKWITTIDGKAVRDRETERRGVRFDLIPDYDGSSTVDKDDVGAVSGGSGVRDYYDDDDAAVETADRPLSLRELRATGDLFVDGKLVRRRWAWTVQRESEGATQRLEDVAREVLLCPDPTADEP